MLFPERIFLVRNMWDFVPLAVVFAGSQTGALFLSRANMDQKVDHFSWNMSGPVSSHLQERRRDMHTPQWSCNRTFEEPQGVIVGTFGGFGLVFLDMFVISLCFLLLLCGAPGPEKKKKTETT